MGFNAKRSDYGLPALPAKQLEISEGGKKVLAAAQAFQALRQPGKDLRYRVCQTTLARGITAAKVANLGTAPLAVLHFIILHINNDTGYAWVSHQRLAILLTEQFGETYNPKGVKACITALKKARLIEASDADKVGAGGVVGPTYSLLPSTPGDWIPEIDALNRQLGHTPESGGKVTVRNNVHGRWGPCRW